MSNELAKFINSRRRHKTDVKVARQVKIAKAMDCGQPGCMMCGNPRKTHKDRLTAQEKRLFQDVEKTSDKHSNGLTTKDEDEN